jgi:hypothetical protein
LLKARLGRKLFSGFSIIFDDDDDVVFDNTWRVDSITPIDLYIYICTYICINAYDLQIDSKDYEGGNGCVYIHI